MFSGFSSFLGFNPQGSETVQALLQKTDLVLDELLDDEGLLTELKTLNNELLTFLKSEENYTKMINHVILEPSIEEQQLNPQRCFKFPLVSTDVLSSECTPLVLYLLNCNDSENEGESEENDTCEESGSPDTAEVDQAQKIAKENSENPKYIDLLFSLLEKKDLNYTAAGYFAKIVTNLLEKHSSEFLAYLFKKRPEQLEKLTNQISSDSIADLLLKILTFESNSIDDPEDETYNAKRVQTLKLLIQKLNGQQYQELAANAACIVTEVLDRWGYFHKCNETISCLFETEAITDMYQILKTKNTSATAVTNVLTKILEHHLKKAKGTNKEEKIESGFGGFGGFAQPEAEEIKLSGGFPIVAVTLENIQSIIDVISESLESDRPFGNFRLKLVDLVNTILEANNDEIMAKIAESELLKTAMKLFYKFEWNNMLHIKLEKLIVSVINGEHENLKVALFEGADILNSIVEAFEETDIPVSEKSNKTIRRGYLGQLTTIANKINESEDPVVKKYADENKEWEDFVTIDLDSINKRNRMQLGGVNPKFERYGSFEIQHWSMMSCIQKNGEEQQNNQEGEGKTEESKGCNGEEEIEQSFSVKTLQLKFSQIGGRRKSLVESAEEEIVEEIKPNSPVEDMKCLKFEDMIEESIEEDIHSEQNLDGVGQSTGGGLKIPGKFF